MAHAFIADARTQLELDGHPDPDDAYADLEDIIFDDTDFEFLFEAEFEGIEDTQAGQIVGIANLAFADLFKPFRDGVAVHPFAAE